MRMRRPVALAVLATVVLIGCGGDDPDSTSPSEPVPSTSAPRDPSPTAATAPTGPSASATSDGPPASVSAGAGPTTATLSTEMPPATDAAPPATTSVPSMPQVELAAWQTLPITDVDGTTFTLADLVGKPVLVETFATWCSNCRAQLGDTNAAAGQVGDAAHVLALSVETDLDASAVADYAVEQGFDNIRFAVMSPELLAAMVDAFGNTVANPPATPKVVVDAAGRVGDLTTGYESPDELVAQVAPAG